MKEIMQSACQSDAVRVSDWSSAVFCPMRFTRRFWCREKQSVRISVISKLLLNRKEVKRVIYMKKLRLVDMFPTVYHLNHSDQPIVKIRKKTAAATRRPPHHFQN